MPQWVPHNSGLHPEHPGCDDDGVRGRVEPGQPGRPAATEAGAGDRPAGQVTLIPTVVSRRDSCMLVQDATEKSGL